jgi:hypothetical protein
MEISSRISFIEAKSIKKFIFAIVLATLYFMPITKGFDNLPKVINGPALSPYKLMGSYPIYRVQISFLMSNNPTKILLSTTLIGSILISISSNSMLGA